MFDKGSKKHVDLLYAMKKKNLEHWKVIALYLVLYDAVAVNLSYFWDCFFGLTCTFPVFRQII